MKGEGRKDRGDGEATEERRMRKEGEGRERRRLGGRRRSEKQ